MRNQKNVNGYISGTGCAYFTFVKGGILIHCYRVATTIEVSFLDVDDSYDTSYAINHNSAPIERIPDYQGHWVEESWDVFVPFGKVFKITKDRESVSGDIQYFIATPKKVSEIRLYAEIDGLIYGPGAYSYDQNRGWEGTRYYPNRRVHNWIP